MTLDTPTIDFAGLSPVIALSAGIVVVLLAGLPRRWPVAVTPALAVATLGAAGGLAIWQWGVRDDLVAGALRLDELALAGALIAIFAALVCTLLAIRDPVSQEGYRGEYLALMLGSTLGMVLLVQAQNLVSFFIALELLSIPLYMLCAADVRRERSLESGLKYLVIGSLGSATLLYGSALIYGGAGSTDFGDIAEALGPGGQATDSLVLIGVAMIAVGMAFKVSLAPFHQWTPDVYEGAPTPVTAFMSVATKAAALIAFVRIFEVALGPVAEQWQAALAALAAVSIAVGNIGALGQDSLKRLLGYSSIAQAGYMLVGIVVFTEVGVNALVFYLAAYGLMNLAGFTVIVARERETPYGDDIRAVEGIGQSKPLLAWPLTISMLALAGLPGTAGFIGKLLLISAAADGGYTWLAVVLVVGTMVSLAYYLRVVAAVWMRPAPAATPAPAIAGGAGAVLGASRCGLVVGAGLLCAAATVFFGIVPSPLVDWASAAGESIAPFIQQ